MGGGGQGCGRFDNRCIKVYMHMYAGKRFRDTPALCVRQLAASDPGCDPDV
jgi:hypothetical protein